MEGGASPSFPFYRPDDESCIVYLPNVNRKEGCSAIKCCTLPKLVEKLTQSINYDNYSVSAFFLTYRDYTAPMEVLQLLIARFAGPPPGSSKDHLRLFEIEVEIVQSNVINMFRQLIGTLNEKEFEDKAFSKIATEFMNSLPEDARNELFLIYYNAKKLAKSPSTRTIVPPKPNNNNISSASSTMRFSFSVSPRSHSPGSTSNVLQGLLNNGNGNGNSGGNSPTNSTHLQPSTSSSSDYTTRSSIKLPKGFMSKILPSSSSTNLMAHSNSVNSSNNNNSSYSNSSNNSNSSSNSSGSNNNSSNNNSSSSNVGSSSISNSSSASSLNLHNHHNHHHSGGGQNIDEDNPHPEKTAFAPELIARELTVMEFELISALTLNEFSQRQWNKENQAINIQNLITWFNRISSWVSTKIISKETPEERAVIIEAFINIATYAKELKNYNCVMEILGSLHNSSISRLKNSWALISQKANDMFQVLNQIMSPDINFKLYRKHLGAVLPSEPCIPYLGLFLTDYTYLFESNPPTLGSDGSMVNVERIYLISARIQEFFRLFTNCSYGFTSAPQIREAILAEKVWEENEIFRLSKIREEQSSGNSGSSSGGASGSSDGKNEVNSLTSSVSGSSSSGSSLSLSGVVGVGGGEKRRKNFVTKYRMSFTGNDPPPSISPTLSERDWKILTTNAKTIKCKKGKKILSMGEVNHSLYRVESGRVKFENVSSPEDVRYIEMGEIFGEESFLYDRPMAFNVLADSDDCELIEIEKTFILQLFLSEPILAATYFKHIAVLMADRLLFVLSNDSLSSASSFIGSCPIISINNTSNSSSSGGGSSNNSSNNNSAQSSPNHSPSIGHHHPHHHHQLSTTSTSSNDSNGSGGNNSPSSISPRLQSSQSSMALGSSDNKRRSMAIEPSSMDLLRLGNDNRFISTFGLSPEEVIVKSYTCKHNGITGTLYITKHHLCFEGKFFGIHKQKMNPFEKITKILPEKGGLSLTTKDKVKKYSFKNQDEVTEAYSIMTKIWKNHFNSGIRSPVKSVSASSTPPAPQSPKSPKVGRGESFSGITDLPSKDEWNAILKGAKTVQYKKGDVIIAEGVEFHKIFQIVKGECTIVKGYINDNNDNGSSTTSTTISTPVSSPMKSVSFSSSKGLTLLTKLSTGSIFGEMSFLLQGGSPISVIVSSDVLELYTLEGYFLNIILKSKPLLAPKFYKYLACVLDTRIRQYKQSIL